jgi:hypothetical protein
VQVRCSLELADGPHAVLHAGTARLRLLSSRPDLIANVVVTAGDGIAANSAVRPTGYDLEFTATTATDHAVAWTAVVTLTNGSTEHLTGTVGRPGETRTTGSAALPLPAAPPTLP